MSADEPKSEGLHKDFATACFEAIERRKAEDAARWAKGDFTIGPPVELPEPESLENILRRIVDACIDFNEETHFCASPLSDDEKIERAKAAAKQRLDELLRQHVGYGGLVEIQNALKLIIPPLEEQDRQRLARSPVRWEGVKRDIFYFELMLPALGLFYSVRSPTPNWTSLIDLRSGNTISPKEAHTIKALPPLDDQSREAWARLIVKLTLSEKYWTKRSDLRPDGKLFEAIAARAVRNRQGKSIRQFRKRFGMIPSAFLKLPNASKCEVKDSSIRAENEPLSEAKAARVTKQAEKIVAMKPSPAEFQRELLLVIKERLETNPRN
jgi:hypothetical protein